MFVLTTVLSFAVVYNLGFLNRIYEGHIGIFIGFGVVCVVLGVLAAWCTYKVAKKYVVALIAAVACAALAKILLGPIT